MYQDVAIIVPKLQKLNVAMAVSRASKTTPLLHTHLEHNADHTDYTAYCKK